MSGAGVAPRHPLHRRAVRVAAALASAALIAASALLVASPAYAADFTQGDYDYDITGADTVTVVDYTGGVTATIPATATDGAATYRVTAIGGSAFASKGLTSVTIPNSVTSIGNNAFGSNSLVSVVIPDSVTSMDTGVFQFNSTLTSVTLGNSLTSIPGYTFWQGGLTSITIPASVTSIGEEAFILNQLVSVNVPDSVTSIGREAFSLNGALTSLRLGNSVVSIGDGAFSSTALTTVTLPGSVNSIGDNAFGSTVSLTSAVLQGGAPGTVTARSSGHGSFGDQDVTVYYSSAHAADFTPSPWQGYVTAQGATVTFDLGGHGAAIQPITAIPGGIVSAPANPTATDYTFQGWFTSATGGTPFSFSGPLNSDATAYARWAATGLAATGSEPARLILGGVALTLLGVLALLAVALRKRRARSAVG